MQSTSLGSSAREPRGTSNLTMGLLPATCSCVALPRRAAIPGLFGSRCVFLLTSLRSLTVNKRALLLLTSGGSRNGLGAKPFVAKLVASLLLPPLSGSSKRSVYVSILRLSWFAPSASLALIGRGSPAQFLRSVHPKRWFVCGRTSSRAPLAPFASALLEPFVQWPTVCSDGAICNAVRI